MKLFPGILNLRGRDIQYNPVFFSYVIITPAGVELFINETKLSEEIVKNLKSGIQNVQIHSYENVLDRLSALVSLGSNY